MIQHKTSFGIGHKSFRPTASSSKPHKQSPHISPDTMAADQSLMSEAKMVAESRGMDKNQGYINYVYRRMKYKEGMAINKAASGQGRKDLNKFYGNMSRTYDSRAYKNMYGLYQDDFGGEKMANERVYPVDMLKGDNVINSVIGEIGVLQDVELFGNDVRLIFQDRSFRVEKKAKDWFVKTDGNSGPYSTADDSIQSSPSPSAHTPVAASSAQSGALFKEQVNGPSLKEMETKKKIMDEVNKQDHPMMTKNELVSGIEIEKEHSSTIMKIEEEKPSVEKAASWIAKDHVNEIPDYYSRLKKMEASAKGLFADNFDDEDDDEEDDDDEEFADSYTQPIGNVSGSTAFTPKRPIKQSSDKQPQMKAGFFEKTGIEPNAAHETMRNIAKQNKYSNHMVAIAPGHITKESSAGQLHNLPMSFRTIGDPHLMQRPGTGYMQKDKSIKGASMEHKLNVYRGEHTQYHHETIGDKKVTFMVTPKGKTDKDIHSAAKAGSLAGRYTSTDMKSEWHNEAARHLELSMKTENPEEKMMHEKNAMNAKKFSEHMKKHAEGGMISESVHKTSPNLKEEVKGVVHDSLKDLSHNKIAGETFASKQGYSNPYPMGPRPDTSTSSKMGQSIKLPMAPGKDREQSLLRDFQHSMMKIGTISAGGSKDVKQVSHHITDVHEEAKQRKGTFITGFFHKATGELKGATAYTHENKAAALGASLEKYSPSEYESSTVLHMPKEKVKSGELSAYGQKQHSWTSGKGIEGINAIKFQAKGSKAPRKYVGEGSAGVGEQIGTSLEHRHVTMGIPGERKPEEVQHEMLKHGMSPSMIHKGLTTEQPYPNKPFRITKEEKEKSGEKSKEKKQNKGFKLATVGNVVKGV